ncbi:siderophore-interacting protein [Roseicella frigidaeris]|uniref:Siderophore-interacting protein n=1 Tax=Roseicella frigidaeris TaxID=2230885 RepID=A0A327MGA6_9PROT|nr:siderophore-interacting protein [Roseicella frigidaeris]RAI61074.1 siderophore-interacting protein [Roseicella frigidaeris]
MKHAITRIRHALHWRDLTVRRTEHVTPRMLRLTLAGEALAGFTSLSPDDHIKVFAPGEAGQTERRDYTPRRFDAAAGELVVDFALHEAGPVTAWARGAKPGDAAQIGGPRGSAVVPHDFDWWLLVGDETALPAIGRRIEELPAGTPVTSLVAVTGPEEEQRFETAAAHQAVWVHRPPAQAADPAPLLAALETFVPPAGEGFIWIAAEAGVARALRRHVLEVMRHPAPWLKAAGYWVQGQADASEKLEA